MKNRLCVWGKSMGYFDSVYAAELPHRAVSVYMYLRNRAGKDKSCFPSIGTIARDLSLSKRTVERALADLERAGFLRREARWRTKGGRSSSLYTLVDS
ncbi:transcriptional regulator [Clostridia bacterium]|nr:transcriptional regulator [Clostridia bacterium]